MGVSVVTAIQGRMSLVQTLKSGTTISSLLIQKTNPSDSGSYECIPSNTGPAKINVHVLDGKQCSLWNLDLDIFITFVTLNNNNNHFSKVMIPIYGENSWIQH